MVHPVETGARHLASGWRPCRGERGQTTAEYLVLVYVAVSASILTFNLLFGPVRNLMRTAAGQLLSIVAGTP